jgi:hypothetical protein
MIVNGHFNIAPGRFIMYFLLFLLFLNYSSHGQKFAISADYNNVLYIGIDNPLTIIVPGISNRYVKAEIDQGNLTGANGKYIARVDQTGEVTITVLQGSKIIKQLPFLARRLPDPSFSIAGKTGGTISREGLLNGKVKAIAFPGSFRNISFEIIQFSVLRVFPGGSEQIRSTSGELTSYQRASINRIKSGILDYIWVIIKLYFRTYYTDIWIRKWF